MANARQVGSLVVQMKADLGALKLDIKEMSQSFDSGFKDIQRSAAGLGKALVGAFSLGAVVAFTKGIVDMAGKLQDLSDRTGISAQLLSGMKSTLESSGTSLETFATGIFNAQKNLGMISDEGDQTAKVVKRLGLNLAELRNVPTEEFFRLISDALAKIENPLERNTLGAQLFGKAWKEIGPAVISSAGKLAELKKSGLSNADIKSLDDFGDSLTRLKNAVTLWAAGPVAQGIEAILKLLRLIPLAPIEQMGKSLMELDAATSHLAQLLGKSLGEVNAMTEQELQQLAQYPSRIGKLAQAIIAAKKQIGISEAQVRGGDQPKKTEPFTGLGTGDDAKKKVESFLESMRKQADQLGVTLTELKKGPVAALIQGLDQAFQAAGGDKVPGARAKFEELKQNIVDVNQQVREAKFEFEKFDAVTKRDDQDLAEWAKFTEEVARAGEAARIAAEAIEEAWKNMRAEQAAARFDQDIMESVITPEGLDQVAKDIAKRAEEAWRPWEQVARDVFGGIHTAFQGVMQGTQSLSQAFAKMGMSIALSLNEAIFKILVLEPLIVSLRAAMGATAAPASGGGGGGGGLGGLIGTAVGGFFSWLFGHQGGLVTSAGILKMHSGGEIPAILQSGEFVMQRPAVGQIGVPTLAAMNRTGMVPGAGGGRGISIAYLDARGAQRGVSAEIMRAIAQSENRAVDRSVGEVKNERSRSNNFARAFR